MKFLGDSLFIKELVQSQLDTWHTTSVLLDDIIIFIKDQSAVREEFYTVRTEEKERVCKGFNEPYLDVLQGEGIGKGFERILRVRCPLKPLIFNLLIRKFGREGEGRSFTSIKNKQKKKKMSNFVVMILIYMIIPFSSSISTSLGRRREEFHLYYKTIQKKMSTLQL